MLMNIKCPHCRTEYELDRNEYGEVVKCQVCGKTFQITEMANTTEGEGTVSEKVKDAAKAVAHVAYDKVRNIDWQKQGARVKSAAENMGTMAKKLRRQSGEAGMKHKTRLAIVGVFMEICATVVFMACSIFLDYYGYCMTNRFSWIGWILSLIGWILILPFFKALYIRQ